VVSPVAQFLVYAGVMAAALGCFLAAFATRKDTPVHKRWGIAGVSIDLGGTAVVLFVYRVLGWTAPPNDPDLVRWHRGFAYAATALVVLVGVSGWRRWPLHTRLWPAFLPVYAVTYALALLAYWPF
jgi:hypothetical protein